jgi:hypothetical protein
MKNECVEFSSTTKLKQKRKLSPKMKELLERDRTVVEIPVELMPVIREVIAQYEARVRV